MANSLSSSVFTALISTMSPSLNFVIFGLALALVADELLCGLQAAGTDRRPWARGKRWGERVGDAGGKSGKAEWRG